MNSNVPLWNIYRKWGLYTIKTMSNFFVVGVDLSQVEKRQKAGQLLLTLDFEKDIKKILLFLKDVGVEDNQLGTFLTKNPYILAEDLEALETR